MEIVDCLAVFRMDMSSNPVLDESVAVFVAVETEKSEDHFIANGQVIGGIETQKLETMGEGNVEKRGDFVVIGDVFDLHGNLTARPAIVAGGQNIPEASRRSLEKILDGGRRAGGDGAVAAEFRGVSFEVCSEGFEICTFLFVFLVVFLLARRGAIVDKTAAGAQTEMSASLALGLAARLAAPDGDCVGIRAVEGIHLA